MLKAEIIGNLGQDAIIRNYNGKKFISFSIAHSETYTNQDGTRVEKTVWISCLKFGESKILQYLTRGTRVFVRGDLSTNLYQSNGTTHAGLNCNVGEIQLLSAPAPTPASPTPEPLTPDEPKKTTKKKTSPPDNLPF